MAQSIKNKIEKIGTPLSEWDISINRGILTGYNNAFIITGAKKDELIAEDPKSAELIRPILRGRDIKRYEYNFADLWLIATFPSRKYDIDAYPAIKKHLLSYGIERLEQTGKKHVVNGVEIKSRKKTSNKWFETQDSISYWDDFSKQKIIFQEMVQSPSFCLDNDKHFVCLDTGRIIVGEKLEYLLGLLNSKLFFFSIKYFYGGGGLGGNGVRMKHTFFQQFSAYVPSIDEENYFKKIFEDTISAEISAEIDNFFYSKYSLSKEEISLIEAEFDGLF